MSEETVTLKRGSYDNFKKDQEALRAHLDDGLPVLIKLEKTHFGYTYKSDYEVLYDGDEELKKALKESSEQTMEIKEENKSLVNELKEMRIKTTEPDGIIYVNPEEKNPDDLINYRWTVAILLVYSAITSFIIWG